MSLKTLRTATFLTLMLLAASACKDEEETTYLYLDGTLSIEGLEIFMDASSNTGRTMKLKPKGVTHPEGKEIGYYWKVSPLMEKNDTTRYLSGLGKDGQPSDGSFEYTIKDSLGTYTIYCYAFAEGYTLKSAASYTTLVRGGSNGSITGPGLYDFPDIENSSYQYTTIGNQAWTTSNIYEKGRTSVPFENARAMEPVFGLYYSYEDAVNACSDIEDGEWRLPTDSDWVKMAKHLVENNPKAPEIKEFENVFWDNEVNGTPSIASQLMIDASFNTESLWEYWPAVGDINNRSGLSFIPTGYANLGITPTVKSSGSSAATFHGMYEYAVFWTASEVEDDKTMAYYRYIYGNQPHFQIGKGKKDSFGASVRCVRDLK